MVRNDKLVAELQKLSASFRAKGNAYLEIVKMGARNCKMLFR